MPSFQKVYPTAKFVDASDLGLEVSEWPDEIEYEGRTYSKTMYYAPGDDLKEVLYVSGRYERLVVAND